MKTWNEALNAMRHGKRVKRSIWDSDYIYKYEDVIMKNDTGIPSWSELKKYSEHNDWIIL